MPTELDLNLAITADATGVKTGMSSAKEAVASSSAAMADATKKLEETTKSSFNQMTEALKRFSTESTAAHAAAAASANQAGAKLSSGLKGTIDGLQSSFGALGGVFATVTKHLGLIAGVVAGGAAFKEVINKTNEWNGGAVKLAKSMGITTQEASVLMVATHKLGIDADVLSTATQKVSMQIMKGGEGFKILGVEVKNMATGGFRPATEIIAETNEKIKAIKDPILQNQAGLSAYGKSWAEVRPLMKLTAEEMDKAREKAKALGLEVGPEQVANTKAYKEGMKEFGLALDAISINLGQALMPLFSKMAVGLAELTGWLVEKLKPGFEIVGLVVDTAIEIFREFWTLLSDVGAMVRDGFGTVIHEVFGKSVPGDFSITKTAVNVVRLLFIGFKVSCLEVMEAVKLGLGLLKDEFVLWAKVANRALHLDWKGAKAALAEGTNAMEQRLKESGARMVKIAMDAHKQIEDIQNGVKKESSAKAEDKNLGPQYDFSKKPKGAKEKKTPNDYNAELAELKVSFQEKMRLEGSFVEFTKQQELEFWNTKLAIQEKGSVDEKMVRLKIAEAKLAIDKKSFEVELANLKEQEANYKHNTDAKLAFAQEYADKVGKAYGKDSVQYSTVQKEIVKIKKQAVDQLKQMDEILIAGVAKQAENQIQIEQEASALRVALGQESVAQAIALEQGFEDRRHDIQLKALQDKMKLASMDPDRNPVEIAKINEQLIELEMQYQGRVRAIKSKAVIESNKDMSTAVGQVRSTWESAMAGMLQGTMSLRQGLAAMWTSVLQSFTQFIAKKVTAWALGESVQTSATVAGNAVRTQSDWMAATQSVMASAWAAIKNIAVKAWEAAASVYASIAAIPIVGPFLAPAAAIAASAVVIGFAGNVASAEGGYDIPAGVNPMTQLHEREMVLPRAQADAVRDMASGGGGGAPSITYNDHSGTLSRETIRANAKIIAETLRDYSRRQT